MISCPNCGAPVDPYSVRCEYCHTYYFDLVAWDIENGKPCYVKFKTSQGIVTALARPSLGTIDVNYESTYVTDGFGTPVFLRPKRSASIGMKFDCFEDKKGNLFQIET